ncbi:hypothetical protein EVAR_7848_1 [Eumeta japonica]|uniref:Uncharacterized protein n=1 Tax=Eumeta variegata TaxID=151549 RepID=A0A4C1TV05_EUMVA|nr:hypothetical protein EVAR_7848_1 [Eumeta japonica]
MCGNRLRRLGALRTQPRPRAASGEGRVCFAALNEIVVRNCPIINDLITSPITGRSFEIKDSKRYYFIRPHKMLTSERPQLAIPVGARIETCSQEARERGVVSASAIIVRQPATDGRGRGRGGRDRGRRAAGAGQGDGQGARNALVTPLRLRVSMGGGEHLHSVPIPQKKIVTAGRSSGDPAVNVSPTPPRRERRPLSVPALSGLYLPTPYTRRYTPIYTDFGSVPTADDIRLTSQHVFIKTVYNWRLYRRRLPRCGYVTHRTPRENNRKRAKKKAGYKIKFREETPRE